MGKHNIQKNIVHTSHIKVQYGRPWTQLSGNNKKNSREIECGVV